MRLFTGIELPESTRNSISEITKKIKSSARIKWVEKENLHITLKFFGEVANHKELIAALNKASDDFKPFDISLEGVGAFPSPERVRVIWVGIKSGYNKIQRIFERIEEETEKIGFEKEKREFTPHITIGRVKKGKFKLPDITYNYPPFKVKNVILYKSTLTPEGPIYEVIEKFPGSDK